MKKLSITAAVAAASLLAPRAQAFSLQRERRVSIGDVQPSNDPDIIAIPVWIPPYVDKFVSGAAGELYAHGWVEIDPNTGYYVGATAFAHLSLPSFNIYPVWASAWMRLDGKDVMYDALLNGTPFGGPNLHVPRPTDPQVVPAGYKDSWAIGPYGTNLPQQMVDLGPVGKLYFDVKGSARGSLELDAQIDSGEIGLDFAMDASATISLQGIQSFGYTFTLLSANARASARVWTDWWNHLACGWLFARGGLTALVGPGIYPFIPPHDAGRFDNVLFDQGDCTSF